MKKQKVLPRTPSALIRLALRDLEAVEQMKKTYRVDMSSWHDREDGKCEVCFAGVVMARHLGAKQNRGYSPSDFPDNIEQLEALNKLRQGSVTTALALLRVGLPPEGPRPHDRSMVSYRPGRKREFKAQMRKLADELETFGL